MDDAVVVELVSRLAVMIVVFAGVAGFAGYWAAQGLHEIVRAVRDRGSRRG